MRFVWAVVAFVLATLMIGAGIAQRTVLQGPKTESQAIQIDEQAPYILIDGAVLNTHDGSQTLRAQGDGTIFAAYARTVDVEAWLQHTDYVQITSSDDELTSELVTATSDGADSTDASSTDAAATPPATDAPADTAPDATAATPLNPVGSDLWLDEFQQDDLLITPLQLPDDMSLLVASDGTNPAPTDLTVTWPTGTSAPWSGPLIVGGAILLAVGIVLYILGLRHVRRSRGPRRKGLPMAATQPIDLSIEEEEKGVISAAPTRRRLGPGKRAFAVVPVVAVSALLFAGCSADSWPQLASTATPTPTPTVVMPEGQQSPAVTEAQAQRILTRVADEVAAADEAKDPAAAATRLAGPALAERETNYTLRGAIADHPALAAVPDKPVSILLPEAYDQWPRTFLAVVEGTDDAADTIMMLTQEDPWSDYKLTYTAKLAADSFPTLAPAYVGAGQVAPDSAFLLIEPQELAAAYADVLNNGDASEYASLFEADGDSFRTQVATDRETRSAQFNETGAETGKLEFTSTAGDQPPVALQTLESGAIVSVNLNETETVTPTTPDAVIKVDTNPIVSTLTGVTQSATGFSTTYSDQLFFYVPAAGSNERIQFLGYGTNILNAKVVS